MTPPIHFFIAIDRVGEDPDLASPRLPRQRVGTLAMTPEDVWMAIIPVDDELVCAEFEHAEDLDTDAYPAPEDIINRSTATFTDLEALLQTLTSKGIDTDTFTEPWKTDYPAEAGVHNPPDADTLRRGRASGLPRRGLR